MAGKIHPGLDKLSNILRLGLRPRGSKNSSLPLSGKFIFLAITVIAIKKGYLMAQQREEYIFKQYFVFAVFTFTWPLDTCCTSAVGYRLH